MRKTHTVAVVGLGYVGLPLAILADKMGYPTIGIDIDPQKIECINNKRTPFQDEKIDRELKSSHIIATIDFERLRDCSIIVICVPTPIHKDNSPNLEPLVRACEDISKHLHKEHLVILESTVNPGVSESIVLPILERRSGLKAEEDFYLAHCPERLNPGDTSWNVRNINRVVGALSETGLERTLMFYRSIITGKVTAMQSIKEAEAVKIVENTFRDINIAFVNELAMSFSKLNIDIVNVIEGASTKPFGYMPHYPGCGVGGHCIPVDPYYLIDYAKKNGFEHDFLSLARKINRQMTEFTAELVLNAMIERGIAIPGKKVALLGLAYKPEIDDCRESPSFEIARYLTNAGILVSAYDPYVPERSSHGSLADILEGASAVVIATAHKVFKNLTPEHLIAKQIGILIDGRNCLPKEQFVKAGVLYKGIGR